MYPALQQIMYCLKKNFNGLEIKKAFFRKIVVTYNINPLTTFHDYLAFLQPFCVGLGTFEFELMKSIVKKIK